MAATSTKRKRLSIGGAFGRGAGGVSDSEAGSRTSSISIRQAYLRQGAGGKGEKVGGKELIPRAPSPLDRAAAVYAATSTLMVRGFASSRNGSFTVSTPFLYSALTLDESTVVGSVNDR